MKSKPRIAVIVPARNAMATLPACVDALMCSFCGADQIIIFDDGLNPGIGEFSKTDPISIVSNDGERVGATRVRNAMRARNLAARQASADILAFVDADVVVEKEALGRLVAALESGPEIAAAFGCYWFDGDVIDLDEPSGAACMFGGVSPCGLAAGAPPLPVVTGPVEPCGWLAPSVVGDCVVPLPDSALAQCQLRTGQARWRRAGALWRRFGRSS